MDGKKNCSVEGCDGEFYAKGLCKKHYHRSSRHGDPLVVNKRGFKPRYKKCSIEGCEGKHVANGYCEKHNRRFLRHGDPLGGRENIKRDGCCSVEGCEEPIESRGFCSEHFYNFSNYGDPLIRKKQKNKGGKCSIPGCEEEAHAKGLCQYHYDKERMQSDNAKARHKIHVKRYHSSEKGKNARSKAVGIRRARVLGVATEDFTNREIFERDNWCCGICNRPVDPELEWPHPGSPSLDHVKPLARGGSHTMDNVQLAHLRCNLMKNDKLPEEFEVYQSQQASPRSKLPFPLCPNRF